jgi:hypothetical protein
MNRTVIMLTTTLLIAMAGISQSGRDHGVKLPSCFRLLQMEHNIGLQAASRAVIVRACTN